jgi:sulfur-oxidizing protein SoxZ
MSTNPRIWLSSKTPKQGEVVVARALVTHPMETGFRKTDDGKTVPRKIIREFVCTLNGKPVVRWALETGVSANPYLEFRFRAVESGTLTFVWVDDDGTRSEASETLTAG